MGSDAAAEQRGLLQARSATLTQGERPCRAPPSLCCAMRPPSLAMRLHRGRAMPTTFTPRWNGAAPRRLSSRYVTEASGPPPRVENPSSTCSSPSTGDNYLGGAWIWPPTRPSSTIWAGSYRSRCAPTSGEPAFALQACPRGHTCRPFHVPGLNLPRCVAGPTLLTPSRRGPLGSIVKLDAPPSSPPPA